MFKYFSMSVIHRIGSVFDSTFGVFLVFVSEHICICISLFLYGLACEVSNSLALVLIVPLVPFLVFVIKYICICISLFLYGLAWEVSNSLALVLWLVVGHQTTETTTSLLVCSDNGIRGKQANDQEYLVWYLYLFFFCNLYLC